MDRRQAVCRLPQSWRGHHDQVHLGQSVDVGVLHRADGRGCVESRAFAGPEGADLVIGHPETQVALHDVEGNGPGLLGVRDIPYPLNRAGRSHAPLDNAAGRRFFCTHEFLLGAPRHVRRPGSADSDVIQPAFGIRDLGIQRDAHLNQFRSGRPRPVPRPNAGLAHIGLRPRHWRQNRPGAVAEDHLVGTGCPDGPPHQPHFETGRFRQDVRHLKWNGVGRVLVEHLPVKVAS